MNENNPCDLWDSPLDPIRRKPSPWGDVIGNLFLNSIVFLSGGAVMMYEFLAVRFLQRNFGSTLEVWAAEIAVCMAGLALGYAWGGVVSERAQKEGRRTGWRYLGKALAVAGATGYLIEPIADWTGELLLRGAPRWWHPLLAAGACSFLSLFALGSIIPQAVQLQIARMDRAGRTAGWVSFLSTTGSIVGVLTVALLLLPRYGVREITWVLSGGLLCLGVVVAVLGRRFAAGCSFGLLACILVLFTTFSSNAEIIFEQYTAYHHILVEDKGDKRILWFDRTPQSTMSRTNSAEGGFEYTDFFHVPFILHPTIDEALFVGLGGGTGPKAFLKDYPNLKMDVVEIDPVVVRIARDFFFLPDSPRLSISVADGRQFLRRSTKQYGAVIMDAYASGPYGAHIPFHLATKEFFLLARDRLAVGGSLVYNVIGVAGGLNDSLLRDMLTTLREVFEQVFVYQAASSLNTVFVAQRAEQIFTTGSSSFRNQSWPNGPWLLVPTDPKELTEMSRLLLSQGTLKRRVLPLRTTQISRLQNIAVRGRVLTDNFAPVDLGSGIAPNSP